uniref:Uncharacterized protein n=1 Tax=Oryza sativa subsp. japonica TaxID=39947 RepID=Q2QVX1_ORYSJ|nr:hypothetical protein LOC_Os12g11350 [Oryza sativa Japonica Group]
MAAAVTALRRVVLLLLLTLFVMAALHEAPTMASATRVLLQLRFNGPPPPEGRLCRNF